MIATNTPARNRNAFVANQSIIATNANGVSDKFTYHLSELLDYLRIFRSQMRIAVVYGGDKNQDDAVIYRTTNPRPWKSYETVAGEIQTALQELGFENVITLPDDITLAARLKANNIHLVWLNTGGVQGYNPVSHAASMLEMLGIPYVGHNPLDATRLDNKHMFKRELQALGIRTAPFVTWHPAEGPLRTDSQSRFGRVFGNYKGPFVIKPVSGRASLNIEVVDHTHLVAATARNLVEKTRNTILIETYLPGREFCVAVCGRVTYSNNTLHNTMKPFAFSAIERILQPDETIFTSMDYKAITRDRMCLLPANDPQRTTLLDLARTIYTEFNLSSLVRIDVRADTHGNLYVLEANPKPDLTRATGSVTSLIGEGLGEHHLSYNDLILSLFLDRMHHLFTYMPGNVSHLAAMLCQ